MRLKERLSTFIFIDSKPKGIRGIKNGGKNLIIFTLGKSIEIGFLSASSFIKVLVHLIVLFHKSLDRNVLTHEKQKLFESGVRLLSYEVLNLENLAIYAIFRGTVPRSWKTRSNRDLTS